MTILQLNVPHRHNDLIIVYMALVKNIIQCSDIVPHELLLNSAQSAMYSLGWSQADLSQCTGMQPSNISRLFNGRGGGLVAWERVFKALYDGGLKLRFTIEAEAG